MTETLQQKIESSYQIPEVINHCNLKYHRVVVNKAIQELREELIEEKNVTLKFVDCGREYNKGKLDMIDEILTLIGEKRT